MCEPKDPTILVVDDVKDAREVLSIALRRAGYCVLEAATGGESIDILNTRCGRGDCCPDLILLDIDLPDIKGGTIAKWVRAAYPQVAIILLTAYGRLPAFEDIALEVNAPLVTKPVELDELLSSVAVTLRDFQGRREQGKPVSVPAVLRDVIEEVAQKRAATGAGLHMDYGGDRKE
jgi:CheY-like chemotaxis protein